MTRVFQFAASVTYRSTIGETKEEFPVYAFDPTGANRLAFAYVLQTLKLEDFELRVVGA